MDIMNERDIAEGQAARDWYFNRFGVDETQSAQAGIDQPLTTENDTEQMDHQVEPVSVDAATMGNISLSCLQMARDLSLWLHQQFSGWEVKSE